MRFGKKLLSSLLALVMTALPATATVTMAVEDNAAKLDMKNDFVSVSVHKNTGRFSVRTVGGSPLKEGDNDKALLFVHRVPETSFTTFRINGKDYIYGNHYGILQSDGKFTYNPAVQGLTSESEWSIEGLKIKQTLVLLEDKANPNVGNVKVTYTVRNGTTEDKQVGSRILLDTMLGAEDASPVSVSGSSTFIRKETELKQAPVYWKAVDDPLAPRVTSYGLLNGWGNTSPDRMIFAHWNGISETKWDYAVHPELDFTSKQNPYGAADSAVALYWDPATLRAGEEQVYETYYGLGSFYTTLSKANYNLQLFSPEKLTLNSGKDGYNEQQFAIEVELDNTVDKASPLANVTASLNLPEELELVPGDKAVKSLAGVAVNEAKSLKWMVKAKPQANYRAVRYQVAVQAEGQDEIVRTNYIILPALTGRPPDIQVYDVFPRKLFSADMEKSIALKGKGFDVLKGSTSWGAQLIREGDGQSFSISLSDVTVLYDGIMTIRLDDALFTGKDARNGMYKLRINTAYGAYEQRIELTPEVQYKSRSYGILLVVGTKNSYDIVPVDSEAKLTELKGQYAAAGKRILLELRGNVKEVPDAAGSFYELESGGTINSVIRFDTNRDVWEAYRTQSTTMRIQKQKQDAQHGGDYIEMAGIGILSIPNFPFMSGEFRIELEDGKAYSLSADPQAGEEPIEIGWAVQSGKYAVQQMDFFPVKIKNAVVGEQSVTFGGSLALNFGALHKVGRIGPGIGEEEEMGFDGDGVSVRIDVDEARYGIRQANDRTGAKGTFGLLGLRAEGEAGFPEDLIPGIDLGASGRVAIDTIDRKYEVEANVKFQVLELGGLFTLRFTEGHIPIPDNFLFVIGGDPGIPIIPTTPVAYITKGGGGFKNLYDTLLGNFEVLPPLKLVMIGGIDIAKVVKADNATLELSMRGVEFSTELEIARLKILKEVYGHMLLMDSLRKLGLSVKIGAKLEIFDIVTGEVYASFGYDSSKQGFFGPITLAGGGKVSVHVPKAIPIIGGAELGSAEAELSTEQAYFSAKLLDIPVSLTYRWGDSAPKLASLGMDPRTIGRLEQGVASKTFYNEETGAVEGTMQFGTNIRKAGRSDDKLAALQPMSPTVTATADGLEHRIRIANQEYAFLEFAFSGAVPKLQVYRPDGSLYTLKENVNYRIQEIPAEESESGKLEQRMYVSLVKPQSGEWKVASDKPVQSALYEVTAPPVLTGVQVKQTGSHSIQVNWQGEHVTDEKVALYITENAGNDAGRLLKDDIAAGNGMAEYTLPASMASGTYYVKAVLYKDGTSYSSKTAEEPVTVVNPYQPSAPSDIRVGPAGNGLLQVDWSMKETADGYYLQVLDEANQPIKEAGVIEVKGDRRQAVIGGSLQGENGSPIGIKPGQTYKVSVTAYKNAEEVQNFGSPSYSGNVYVPVPAPAKLQLHIDAVDGGIVREAYDETGQLYYSVNRSQAVLRMSSDQNVTASMKMNGASVLEDNQRKTVWQQPVMLKEGSNLVNVLAVNEKGDTSVAGIKIVADTAAPELKLESPSAGQAVGNGESVIVKGVTEAGSMIAVNGTPVAVTGPGMFETSLSMAGTMSKKLVVTAEDAAGNVTAYETNVANPSIDAIESVHIHHAAAGDDTVGLRGKRQLQLVGTDAGGKEYVIDGGNVSWDILDGDKLGMVSETGLVEAGEHEGNMVVKASYRLSEKYALEDAVTVKIRANGGSDPGPGTKPENENDDMYRLPPENPDPDQGTGSSGGNEPGNGDGTASNGVGGTGNAPAAPGTAAPGTPAQSEFERVIRNIIENEKNVEFLKSVTLSPDGDTFISIGEDAELTVPRQTLGKAVGLGIGRVRDSKAYEDGGKKVAGRIYEFKFNTPMELNRPALLRFRFNPQLVSDAGKLAVYWRNERKGRWEYVGGQLNAAEHTVTAQVQHFSKYALLENHDFVRFGDMDGRWSQDIVYRLASIGIVNGSGTAGAEVFEPERHITRQEFMKLMAGLTQTPPAESDADLGRTFADAGQVQPWAVPYVKAAVKRSWVGGTTGASGLNLEPLRSITRAEATAMIGRMLSGVTGPAPGGTLPFADAGSVPTWSREHVEALYANGIIAGYPDDTFRADAPITREEAASMIGKTLDLLYKTGKEIR
ncbi:S-layer homology domain-containing protein [Paenibacillus allorhizosphaerae]|uniref:SLH domain-containing protein n=1 Tax=Paenibacillus allorhizosphaerae TaxID=2849866 RepID=A0ABN7TKH3_9BACL|nr:S-layer homology domain-containing protein [Paenibacillus allorhizosphaerae]CAG7643891.1 hypothetical protein PAECIP111802_03104 [Paenibacillus allorhizosphaerae]